MRERGETLIIVIVIVLGAIILFIFPLMAMSDRNDDITQSVVETSVSEFVNDVRTTGILTMDKYNKLVEELSATGNVYNVEMELRVLDENPGKKTTQAESTKVGENVYVVYYNSQVMDLLNPSSGVTQAVALKEGDFFYTKATIDSTTIADQLKSFLYAVSGSDVYSIAAEDGGIVTVNGSGN